MLQAELSRAAEGDAVAASGCVLLLFSSARSFFSARTWRRRRPGVDPGGAAQPDCCYHPLTDVAADFLFIYLFLLEMSELPVEKEQRQRRGMVWDTWLGHRVVLMELICPLKAWTCLCLISLSELPRSQ